MLDLLPGETLNISEGQLRCTLTQIFSVSELNGRIKDRLEADPRLHDLWARGELSNVTNHRSGHSYFTLKDSDSSLSCVLFRSHASGLKFELKDGLNVFVYGDIDVYRPRGQVQLVARGLKLDSGLGFRHREFERIRALLESEGLFDLDRKRSLPRFPTRIGIVTSPDGAALRDVLRMISSYPARIVISPAQVQGEGAPESISAAIISLQGKTDLVIVCRGGGSAEDLWPFNSESVARAISSCDSPVISAIGHETDFTIADFAADVRAPTPTAAAEMAVPDPGELLEELQYAKERMARAVYRRLEMEDSRLEYLGRSLSARRMYSRLGELRQELDYVSGRLQSAEMARIEALRVKLEISGSNLSSVSPLATLSRGYAIARLPDGKLITSSEDVSPGEKIEVVLKSGMLLCNVEEKSR
jgi:exodeoxyribonuclease VII large subunit